MAANVESGLRAMFDAVDRGGSGYIDAMELRELLQAHSAKAIAIEEAKMVLQEKHEATGQHGRSKMSFGGFVTLMVSRGFVDAHGDFDHAESLRALSDFAETLSDYVGKQLAEPLFEQLTNQGFGGSRLALAKRVDSGRAHIIIIVLLVTDLLAVFGEVHRAAHDPPSP